MTPHDDGTATGDVTLTGDVTSSAHDAPAPVTTGAPGAAATDVLTGETVTDEAPATEVVDPNAATVVPLSELPHPAKAPGALGVGIIGTGVISEQYLRSFWQFPDVEVRFLADLDVERAQARAEEFEVRDTSGELAAGTVEELLAREDVDIVVNLTIPAAHAEVDRRILEAGKHVWSEKPIAMAPQEARELLALADEKGLRLACAPDTMLGPGIQTALRAVASGEIGDVLTGSFVFQTGGPESWHPSPEFLFTHGAGPLFDMGPYYVSAAVRLFGPVARVMAVSSTARDTRVIGSGPKAGTEFPVDVPTHHAALLTFASGASAQAVFSFQSALPRIGEIEVSGTEGSIALPDPNMFAGDSTLRAFPEGLAAPETRTLPVPEVPFARGAGVVDLARSLRDGVPEQASGAMAAHGLDVLIAIRDAAAEGRIVDVDLRSLALSGMITRDDRHVAASCAVLVAMGNAMEIMQMEDLPLGEDDDLDEDGYLY